MIGQYFFPHSFPNFSVVFLNMKSIACSFNGCYSICALISEHGWWGGFFFFGRVRGKQILALEQKEALLTIRLMLEKNMTRVIVGAVFESCDAELFPPLRGGCFFSFSPSIAGRQKAMSTFEKKNGAYFRRCFSKSLRDGKTAYKLLKFMKYSSPPFFSCRAQSRSRGSLSS